MSIRAEDIPKHPDYVGVRYGSETLLNPHTKEVWNVDHYRLRELGIPDGYIIVDNLTTAQWLHLFCNGLE